MLCQCGLQSKYKCKCGVRYCLVACYKTHAHVEPPAASSLPSTPALVLAPAKPLTQQNPLPQPIVDMLALPTLQFHLNTLLEILNRPITDVPQREYDVAKLKLNALRIGGAEANQEVEAFVEAVLTHLDGAN